MAEINRIDDRQPVWLIDRTVARNGMLRQSIVGGSCYWTGFAQPRFHHQWRPDELRIERKIGAEVLEELRKRGHHVVPWSRLGLPSHEH